MEKVLCIILYTRAGDSRLHIFGFTEEESVAVAMTNSKSEVYDHLGVVFYAAKFTYEMFIEEKNEHLLTWCGVKPGPENVHFIYIPASEQVITTMKRLK